MSESMTQRFRKLQENERVIRRRNWKIRREKCFYFYFLIEQFLLYLRYRDRQQSSHEMTKDAYVRPKSLNTIILYIRVGIWVISCHDCYLPLSLCAGFELKTPAVVIGTDCTGSCKSNYHMITTTTARNSGR
jgi:hypothetical protein